MFPESLTQPVRNQFLPNMKLFDKKSYLWETAGMGEGNTMWQTENAIVLFAFRRVSDMIMLDCLSVHHVGPDWNIFTTIGSITISAQTMNDFDLKNLNAPSSN